MRYGCSPQLKSKGSASAFVTVSAMLSFIETVTLTASSKSCGQSERVAALDLSTSVASVISSEYSVAFTSNGITRATGASAQLALFENPSVPAPPPKEEPAPNRGRQALVLISVLATFGLLVWGAWGVERRKRT